MTACGDEHAFRNLANIVLWTDWTENSLRGVRLENTAVFIYHGGAGLLGITEQTAKNLILAERDTTVYFHLI